MKTIKVNTVEELLKETDVKLNKETIKFVETQSSECWKNPSTFQKGVLWYLNSLEFIDTGESIQPNLEQYPENYNILTEAEEILFQHYGISTAVLDWTACPCVAIFFAMDGRHSRCSSEFCNSYSIYAYKQLKKENSPVILGFESPEIKNTRRERQKGCFTYFKKPFNFYFKHNKWPSIEDFNTNEYSEYFDIVRYKILANFENKESLKRLLNNYGLTRGYLYNSLGKLLGKT